MRGSLISLTVFLTILVRAPSGHAAPSRASASQPSEGELAPPARATRVSGSDPASVDQLRGRVVILDFWATWCGPCQAVMPLLDRLHRDHHDQGLTVLGITSEARAVVEHHLRQRRVAYTVASDGRDAMARYAVQGIPTMVIIDRTGKVRRILTGADSSALAEVRQLVPRLLAEGP